MIPPHTKSLIQATVQKYASQLRKFKNSNPVIMIGELKLDRIDQKIKKEAEKLNDRQANSGIKIQGKNKKYEKRKAAITYKSYTVEFKRKLIDKIRELAMNSDAGLSKIIRTKAKQLNIHPKNIFRWFHTKQIKKKEGGRKALYPQMEERLAQFIINNPKMKRQHILRQAKQIMEDLQIPGREYFNFSKGWYERFRQRLVRRKIISGKVEAKRQFDENSDSDFDDSDYNEIKRESEGVKDEFDYSKVKEEAEQSNVYDSEEENEVKVQMKEEKVTKINCEDLILCYSQEISVQEDENRVKKHEYDRLKKQEEKQEAKTDESEEHVQNC